MEFCLLGAMIVRDAGSLVPIPAAKQRVLLAALLLGANRVVPTDQLVEMLWGHEPPPSARPTLHNYVKRLRRALGDAGHSRISTVPAGYQISAGPGELDVTRFEVLQRSAREAARGGSWDRAASQLGAALALWRGMPLIDIPSPVLAARETPRLCEMRLQAIEERIEADLQLGRSHELIPEIADLAAAHPFREGLHAQLMLALYREGRQGEALAAFRSARQVLIDGLGVEPGPALRDLHQRILGADPGLVSPAGSAPARVTATRGPAAGRPGGSPAVVPRQLPATVPYFTGRRGALAALAGLVAQGGETPLVAAVTGTAGVGKTALAVRFAQQQAARFPAGQLYLNLRGFDPADTPVSPGEALTGFLTALNVSPERIPAGLDAQAALYRSLLAGRRMLILLDNARNAQQVRQLLPGSPGCLVLVTSRSLLASLAASDGARLIALDVLTEQEAREFLTRRLGHRPTAADAAVFADLAGLCARLPLALAIAAAQVAARPGLPVETLTRQLRDAGSRLDALNAGEETSDVRSVFSWSYRQLSAPAARMFRLLGLHPGPDVSVAAAASLAGDPGARTTLDELARAHLLTEHLPGRFASHDLLRAYAASCARADEDQAARTEATGRILDHYLHTAHAGALLFNPGQEPLALTAPRPGVVPEALTTHKQAQEWFTAEQAVLLAAIPCAAETGFGRHAWQLAWTGETFFGGRGRWDDHATALRAALAAAQQLGDPLGQAHMHRRLGFACGHLGSYREAHTHYRQALIHSRNYPAVTAEAHVGLAWLYGRQDQAQRSLSHATRALELYQALGNQSGMARALNNAGWCYAELGDDESAIACSERSVVIQRQLGDDFGAAAALDTAGFAHHRKGRYLAAVDCYQQAIARLREVGYGYELGVVLSRLGDAWLAAGDQAAARSAWQEALDVFNDLRHPDAERARAKLAAFPAGDTGTGRTSTDAGP